MIRLKRGLCVVPRRLKTLSSTVNGLGPETTEIRTGTGSITWTPRSRRATGRSRRTPCSSRRSAETGVQRLVFASPRKVTAERSNARSDGFLEHLSRSSKPSRPVSRATLSPLKRNGSKTGACTGTGGAKSPNCIRAASTLERGCRLVSGYGHSGVQTSRSVAFQSTYIRRPNRSWKRPVDTTFENEQRLDPGRRLPGRTENAARNSASAWHFESGWITECTGVFRVYDRGVANRTLETRRECFSKTTARPMSATHSIVGPLEF